MKRKILITAGVLLTLFFIWRVIELVGFKGPGSSARQGRPPVPVEIGNVLYSPIEDVRLFTGTVQPINQYIIAPKVAGRLISINKRIGDRVERGEIVARIDDAEYRQAVLEAEANLKIAQASLGEIRTQYELSTQELARVRSLKEKGIASSSEFDSAVSQNETHNSRLKLALAQVEQREVALTSARIRLDYTLLRAPEPGWVGERYVDEGALLSPNSSVITVVDINRVIVQVQIIERDYGRIRSGQECTAEIDANPGQVFTGTVTRISPVLQESTRMAKMEAEFQNDSHLMKPGMFARLSIVLESKDSAQTVPNTALVTREGIQGVFMIDQTEERNIAAFVPVEKGIASQNVTEILSPNIEGKVVTLGHHLLENGSPVMLPASESPTQKNPTGEN